MFYRLNLNTMTLNVDSPRVYTLEGVPISVTGIAQVNWLKYMGRLFAHDITSNHRAPSWLIWILVNLVGIFSLLSSPVRGQTQTSIYFFWIFLSLDRIIFRNKLKTLSGAERWHFSLVEINQDCVGSRFLWHNYKQPIVLFIGFI